jgi:hypothetical protein
MRCVKNNNLIHPFNQQFITVSTEDIQNKLIENWNDKCISDSKYIYYVGFDLALTSKGTGITMGHLDKDGKCILDFILKVTAPQKPHQVNYEHLKAFVNFLKQIKGFKIKTIISDRYQNSFLQYFTQRGYNTLLFSTDTSDEPYLTLTNKILNQEVKYYFYQQFQDELFCLKHDENKNKVYLPSDTDKVTYFKDVADSVCRVVYNLFLYEQAARKSSNFLTELSQVSNKKKIYYQLLNKNQLIKLEKEGKVDEIMKLIQREK